TTSTSTWAIFVGPGGGPTDGTCRSRRARSGGSATTVDQNRLRLRHPYRLSEKLTALISDYGKRVVESKSRLRTNRPGPSTTLLIARRRASLGATAAPAHGIS